MLIVLQLRGRVSAAVLAREFEVSVRTIHRDVDALSAAGVPIYADRGRHGGIALHDGYQTRLTGLTPGEALALPLANLATTAKDLGLGGDAASARRKLLAALPQASGASAQRVAERFHFDPLPWYHRPEAPTCLPALAEAVWQERRIRVDYEGWEGSVARELCPLGLALKGGLWYLVAMADRRPRTYRVSNIRRLDLLEARFRRPPAFELASHWPASVAEFEARLMRDTATVRLSAEGLRILRAVSPVAADRAESTQRPCQRAGWVEAELPIETPEYSARQLLRLGAQVEVLSPPALRDAIAAEAAEVLDLYARGRRRSTRAGLKTRRRRAAARRARRPRVAARPGSGAGR